MSYSYLQAVFPKFEHSKIYDDKIYSSLDSVSLTNKNEKSVKKEPVFEPVNEKPQLQHETTYKEIEHFDKLNTMEKIQENGIEHEIYIKHILECNYCKNIVKKQFHLENEKLFKEEMIELISFIAFGVFLLMFLEKSKSK